FEDHEHAVAGREITHGGDRGLGRRGVGRDERLDDGETGVAGPVAEGATQSGGLHLLGRALVVVARHGAVDDATAGVLRSADRALASATGALLAVRLLATTTDFGARLDLVRALAGSGELRGDDLVDQRNVDLSAE